MEVSRPGFVVTPYAQAAATHEEARPDRARRPVRTSFGGALSDACAGSGTAAGHEVQRLNVGDIPLDPALHHGCVEIQPLEPGLEQLSVLIKGPGSRCRKLLGRESDVLGLGEWFCSAFTGCRGVLGGWLAMPSGSSAAIRMSGTYASWLSQRRMMF